MNYAFMSFSCPEADLKTALKTAEDLGYSGFEPRVDSGHRHGIELTMDANARREVRAVAEESPVRLCCLATSVRLAGKSTLKQNMEDARRAIELCSDLGIPRIRIFGGPVEEDDTYTDAIERMAEALTRLSDEIAEANVTLCLETHDHWCDPQHVAAVMGRCGGKHVGVNWDVMHTRLAAHFSEEESVAVLVPYIKHVHIHGGTYIPKLSFSPIGTGAIDHRAVLRELMRIGYDGYLSGEWIGWDEPDYLRTEIATMHRYEEELACTK